MSIKINWEKIENHLGWGQPDAPVVFIGMEEGYSGSYELLGLHLSERSIYTEIMETNFENSKKIIKTYRAPCHFMRRRDLMLRNENFTSPSNAQLLEYQKNFGKKDGNVFLLELMPYPVKNIREWPYGGAPFFRDKDRKTYINRLLEHRCKLLQNSIKLAHREAIICYGRGYRNFYRQIFPSDLSWQLFNGFEVADWKGQRVAIVPHFAARPFNALSRADDLFQLMYG